MLNYGPQDDITSLVSGAKGLGEFACTREKLLAYSFAWLDLRRYLDVLLVLDKRLVQLDLSPTLYQ